MADLKLDTARAKVWIMEVQSELNDVYSTLRIVEGLCNSPVDADGKDDTLFEVMKNVQKQMETSWDNARNVFEETWNALDDGINRVIQTGEELTEKMQKLMNRDR